MSDFQVIGISGKAGSGKDYISQRFFIPAGYKQWSFAWHMKVWVVGKGEATHDEVFHTKPSHVRKLLQEEGTERGRNVYGTDVWVRTMFEWMRVLNENCGINKFIVPDVRFPNEADAILEREGQVYRVIAPEREAQNKLTPEQRKHVSETALDDYTKFTAYIYNDPKHAEILSRQMEILLDDVYPVEPDNPEHESWWFDITKWFRHDV